MNTFKEDIDLYLQNTHSRRWHHGLLTQDVDDEGEDQSWLWPCVARADSKQIRPSISQPLVRDKDGLDVYILQYYDQVVCSTTSILDDEGYNPLRFVIMPLAWTSKNTLAAVLAIGATKLAHRDARYSHKEISYRLRVLESLSKGIQNVGRGSDIVQNVEAILSAFILCWCDISDHCKSTWTKHLIGLSGILDACSEHPFTDSHTLRLIKTCRQYLVYHLIMAKATISST
ncbi:fungal-specific transcription factor domain-containing protein [Aspergillus crustosus]